MIGGRTALWRRSQRTVKRLELPEPFTAEGFIAQLARERGRPIELIPVRTRPNAPCGLLVTTDHADVIMYSRDTTTLHRQHILLHEAAHLLCGHDADTRATANAAALLLPNLPAALVHSVLGRTVYSEPQEREAELVASLIRCRAAREARPAAHQDGPRSRIEALFGFPEA